MKAFRTVLFCIGTLTIATAAPIADSTAQASEYEYDYEGTAQQGVQEPAESASHYDTYIHDVQAAATGDSQKKGFSRGSGLRTIAVGSANQAKTALGNQAAAGYQAAYVAKNTLAQSAAQASATAQAALAGKQVILSGLEQQVRDAKVALQGEEMQLQQAKRAAQSAAQAAQQAMHQVNVIQAALNAAQATSENANEAASQAAGELGAQTAMVGAARQRLQALQEQLRGVRIDFEATQAAARKAQAAAQAAQANAAEAAAKAAAAGLGQKHDSSHEETSASQQLESTTNPTYKHQKQHDALLYRGVSDIHKNSVNQAPYEPKFKPVPVPVEFDNTVEIQVLDEHNTHNHNKYTQSIPEIEFEESKAKEKPVIIQPIIKQQVNKQKVHKHKVNKQQFKPLRALDAHFARAVFPQAYVDVNKFFQIQAKERRPSNSWRWW